MQVFKVFAIFDSAVAGYNRPFFMPHNGMAMRTFVDEVNRKADDNPMCKHPADFSLYELGMWDDSTGLFTMLPVPVQMMRAVDVKDKE